MTKAIYAFSGDPITYGHVNIIKRAASVFDELVVGIGINPDKNYLFTLEERREMAVKATGDFPNVTVAAFNGLLVDYASENKIQIVVKGIRDANDFNYEVLLHEIGESQKLGIDTFFLPAKSDLRHISSSAVKALQKEQGLVQEYVPLYVKQKLEERLSRQHVLGVTGEIAAGKSYLCERLVELGKEQSFPVHNIDMDSIGHDILDKLDESLYREARQKIFDIFGNSVRLQNNFVNRKVLGEIVFTNPMALKKLNEVMYDPLLLRLRREMYGKNGLILLNAALLIESNLAYLSNNNVVLVRTDRESQQRRLKARGLTDFQIEKRLASQYDFSKKLDVLEEKIRGDNCGSAILVDNSQNTGDKVEDQFLQKFDLGRLKV